MWARLARRLSFCWLVFASAAGAEPDLMQREPWEACEYCHGRDGRIDSPVVPAIGGQSASYIRKQLHDFRVGRRVSPQAQMRSAIQLLDADDEAAAAAYFASVTPVDSVAQPRGRLSVDGIAEVLFWTSDAARVACVSCHAASRSELADGYPYLFGLNRGYIARQLTAFRDGRRSNDRGGVMRTQAGALDDAQIAALAAYLSSR